jgi:hypothetical protein
MTIIHVDSFDPYATVADATATYTGSVLTGYWETAPTSNTTFVAGQFAGSQAVSFSDTTAGSMFTTTYFQNNPLHHVGLSFQQTSPLLGSGLATYVTFFDGTTAQCSVVFRVDGAIVFTRGGVTGTVIATYPGAFTSNQWVVFEIEAVVNSITGSFTVRTNGATTNTFHAANLNTQSSANAYANKIGLGCNAITTQNVDDFIWSSDPTTLPWLGAVRSYARAPTSDVQKQFIPLTGAVNFAMIDEAKEDGATSYVYTTNVANNDYYHFAPLGTTPPSILGIAVRGFARKSEVSTRTGVFMLKSGVQFSPTTHGDQLTQNTWSNMWDFFITDPNTNNPWTVAGVDAVQIGPLLNG